MCTWLPAMYTWLPAMCAWLPAMCTWPMLFYFLQMIYVNKHLMFSDDLLPRMVNWVTHISRPTGTFDCHVLWQTFYAISAVNISDLTFVQIIINTVQNIKMCVWWHNHRADFVFCIFYMLYILYSVHFIFCIFYIPYILYSVFYTFCIFYILYNLYSVHVIFCIFYILFILYFVYFRHCKLG
jgi:hypothetical protein